MKFQVQVSDADSVNTASSRVVREIGLRDTDPSTRDTTNIGETPISTSRDAMIRNQSKKEAGEGGGSIGAPLGLQRIALVKRYSRQSPSILAAREFEAK